MTDASNEWAALATVAMLVVYELAVVWAQPGTSVAKVALTHGLNANLVHKWRRADEAASAGVVAPGQAMHGGGEFIALRLPQHSAQVDAADIRIELRRGATAASLLWPAQC